jgi:poly-gamma-glutamate synthesis protein (capsule biosynthesis protein)
LQGGEAVAPLDSITWSVKEATMRQTMILTGEINLKTVTDPTVPFRRVSKELGDADLVFANLECLLTDPPAAYATDQVAFHRTREGFYAGSLAGEALKLAGFAGVGCANNVTYGEDAIRASLGRLQELGIPVTGAGLNREEAHRPLIIEKRGVRFGFMQRTSIFWPRGQAAGPDAPGVATLAAHTAYQPRVANRAGVPPIILTMADDTELNEYVEEIKALRPQVDILISSHHWGLRDEVLQYQKQIAHAAVEAGADIVMGHGVHAIAPIEIYKSKPIFYGLGCFAFNEGHGGRNSTSEAVDWLGLLARVSVEDKQVVKVTCVPIRHNQVNETLIRSVSDECDAMDKLIAASKKFGTSLTICRDELVVIDKPEALA